MTQDRDSNQDSLQELQLPGTQPTRVSFNNLTRCMKLFITVTSKLLKIILLKKLV